MALKKSTEQTVAPAVRVDAKMRTFAPKCRNLSLGVRLNDLIGVVPKEDQRLGRGFA